MWRLSNPYKWTPNNYLPNLLNKVSPLNDNSHTPRSAKRIISLERTNDKFAWMYTRNNLEALDAKGDAIKFDKDKSKTLKKLLKK